MAINVVQDVFWEAAKGKLPFEFFYVPGYVVNPPIGQWVSVWPPGTLYPFDANGIVTFFSTSNQDSASGTGIRTLLIGGRDGVTGGLLFEEITLNGTTPVVTVNNYNVFFTEATTVGSNGRAVGTIIGSTGDILRERIDPGFNGSSFIGGFTTDIDHGFVYDLTVNCTKEALFRFQRRRDITIPNSPFVDVDIWTLPGTSAPYVKKFDSMPIRFGPNANGQLLVKSMHPHNRIYGSFSSIVLNTSVL